ncbi:hypothetical protein EW026_g1257 [Hermanssonia centrifuga]|uniref:Uncharacterized protein n=1 Tax=Hermanssonia centrifuga TaxID=98765 RepID=A0A4S4KSU4_9APHY|nr:hypothetical protein EW026_g1257 [Hermanssonia centrifuga]
MVCIIHFTVEIIVLTQHDRYGEDGLRICDAFVNNQGVIHRWFRQWEARQIVQALGSIPSVVILSQVGITSVQIWKKVMTDVQDSFYRRHTPEQVLLAHANRIDFDHPDAIDMPLFAACLADLKSCKQTNIPIYSFSEHQRLEETQYLYGAAVIITEGILALHDPHLRALYDLKIFVQCDSDLMLARRIRRDVKERGRTVDGVLDQYLRYVKPSYDNFVLPTARHADIIVPGSDNSMATASRMSTPILPPPEPWQNLIVIPETPQLKGILTKLRDRTTSRADFIFFTDRLATFLVEKAMEHLPHKLRSVVTPIDVEYTGQELDGHLCGVSILRSGGPLEKGLRRVVHNMPIGSLLIQSEAKTGEPLLLHLALPVCIRERHRAEGTWVFLLDAQIGTAASAFMAIRILLDHGVRQDHIIFVTFLVAREGGIVVLRKAFPDVKIVCSAVDNYLTERWLECIDVEGEGVDSETAGRKVWAVEPGMGHIGDRYYL